MLCIYIFFHVYNIMSYILLHWYVIYIYSMIYIYIYTYIFIYVCVTNNKYIYICIYIHIYIYIYIQLKPSKRTSKPAQTNQNIFQTSWNPRKPAKAIQKNIQTSSNKKIQKQKKSVQRTFVRVHYSRIEELWLFVSSLPFFCMLSLGISPQELVLLPTVLAGVPEAPPIRYPGPCPGTTQLQSLDMIWSTNSCAWNAQVHASIYICMYVRVFIYIYTYVLVTNCTNNSSPN